MKFFTMRKIAFPRFLFLFFTALTTTSCATVPSIQPQVNSFVIARRYDRAAEILTQHPEGYGVNNRLLFYFDQGMVFQLAGRYDESTAAFEQAKRVYDELYTRSLTKIAGSLVWNDYTQPYTGEDFERVLVNVFEALNFAAQGDLEGALVEARDVDSILTAINARYPAGQKNAYRDDPFVRLLMGVLYEAEGRYQDLSDAYVSYGKSLKLYQDNLKKNYQRGLPKMLIKNLLRVSRSVDPAQYRQYEQYFKIPKEETEPFDANHAEVYLIKYAGLSPVKIEESIVLPLPRGKFGKFSFPKYERRYTEERHFQFTAAGTNGEHFSVPMELVQDIGEIARMDLEQRKFRYILKSAGRNAAKYFLGERIEQQVRTNLGDRAGEVVRYASSLISVFSEKADLRSWQTLPARIYIARLRLKPGEYVFSSGGCFSRTLDVKAGTVSFLISRE